MTIMKQIANLSVNYSVLLAIFKFIYDTDIWKSPDIKPFLDNRFLLTINNILQLVNAEQRSV